MGFYIVEEIFLFGFGQIVDKSALTGQDNTFAALFLRIGYGLLKQLACIPMLAVSRALEILGCK